MIFYRQNIYLHRFHLEGSKYLWCWVSGVLDQLYSWDFEANNDDEPEVQEEEAIETRIEENEDSELAKPKKKEKPPQIHDLDD